MSCNSLRPITLLAAALVAAGCQEGTPAAPAEASLDLDLGLETVITQAGIAAEVSGDAESAEALREGATALRGGVRPSVIEVKVRGGTFRYLALVVGVVHHRPDGERVLVRSLVAWTGRPVAALLQVTSGRDQAEFGESARGHWRNQAQGEVWVATAGPANVDLGSLGNPCPVQPADPTRRCVLASWNIRVDGRFRLPGTDGAIEIQTGAGGVHGVVIE